VCGCGERPQMQRVRARVQARCSADGETAMGAGVKSENVENESEDEVGRVRRARRVPAPARRFHERVSVSVVLDGVLVQSWSEPRRDLSEAGDLFSGVRAPALRSTNTVRVRIDGVRLAAKDVGYCVR
jgi:hypothetical protein